MTERAGAGLGRAGVASARQAGSPAATVCEPPPSSVKRPLRAGLLWVSSAALLLTTGFLAYVVVAARIAIAGAEADAVRSTQMAFFVYAKLVLAKGLLPQLLLTFGIWGLADHFLALGARGKIRLSLAIVGASALAAAVVIPTMLTADIMDLPAVKFRDAWNLVQTFSEMTVAVAASVLLTRWIGRRG